MLYEVISLVFQTALLLYYCGFVWRFKRDWATSVVATGLFMLSFRQILDMHSHFRAPETDPREILECIGFGILMYGAHLRHSHDVAQQAAVAAKIRDANAETHS